MGDVSRGRCVVAVNSSETTLKNESDQNQSAAENLATGTSESKLDTNDPPAESQLLDGEDNSKLIGIMYSERNFVVPLSIKIVFTLVAFAMVAGLMGYTAAKRYRYLNLLVDGVMEPMPLEKPQAIAPDFTLNKHNTTDAVQLSKYRGQWVLLNFWATWCPPCRDEMPSMELLNRRFKDRMTMIAVSVDDDPKEIDRFFGNEPPSFTVLWDSEKRASASYNTYKFPETYLIAPDGSVAAKFVGPRDWFNQASVQYFDEVISGKRKPINM